MRYTVDDTNGEITVTVTEYASRGLFTTLFENDPESTQTMDFRSYEENGLPVFEIRSEDWGTYGESGTTDGFGYKVDHLIPDGMDSCDCDVDLDVSDKATGEWITVRQPISTWVDSDTRTGNELLNLQYDKTGFVLYPKLESQNSNNGAGSDVEFKLRNIRWVILTPPDLVNEEVTLTRNVETEPVILTNNGGGFVSSCAIRRAPALPSGLNLAASSDGNTCVITGTPSNTIRASVEVTAINANGMSSANVIINVDSP